MNFGQAIEQLRLGAKVQRAGWNGKNMYIFLATSDADSIARTSGIRQEIEKLAAEDPQCVQTCFVMKNAKGRLVPGWLASQEDMLANDWAIVL